MSSLAPELEAGALAACTAAAAVILAARERLADIGVERKADGTQVSAVDRAASALIVSALQALDPRLPVVSEEAVHDSGGARRFWLVDPLDGTREFLRGSDLFSINIALIDDGVPVFGVVHLPARNTCYHGGRGRGAWRDGTPLGARRLSGGGGLRVIMSPGERAAVPARHAAALMAHYGRVEFTPIAGAIKFCWLAEGSADLYPRQAPSCGWDSAAGQAVLEGAGGCVLGPDWLALSYRQTAGWYNPAFIAAGDATADWRMLLPDGA